MELKAVLGSAAKEVGVDESVGLNMAAVIEKKGLAFTKAPEPKPVGEEVKAPETVDVQKLNVQPAKEQPKK